MSRQKMREKSSNWYRNPGVVAALMFTVAPILSAQSDEAPRRQVTELGQSRLELAESEKVDPGGIVVGPLSIGGAIRANYIYGDFDDGIGPRISDDFEFDTFRFNLDFSYDEWTAAAEYRFYDGYNLLHTGWVGYNFADGSQIQIGVNRVPFGPGPYGISQSWFKDQHYYVGLSDDMDLGVKYTMPLPDMTLDLAYYFMDEGHWDGDSKDSARFSYDVVNETGEGYEERHQFNIRAIYHYDRGIIDTDLGASAQYGRLHSEGPQGDGYHYAGSAHMANTWNNLTLASQFTYFNHEVSRHTLTSGAVSDKLIDMGARDFAWPVAAEGYIPAVSLSYYQSVGVVDWLDYVIPYLEYSSIIKPETGLNNSDLVTLGAAWSRGGWYIHTDLAYSNGNYFIAEDSDFGTNVNDDWNYRFNINFGYYF